MSRAGVERRRILLISPAPPPAGGVATWTAHVFRSSLGERFELALVNTSPGAQRGWSVDKVGRYLRFPREVARALAQFRPDLVHINSPGMVPHFLQDSVYAEAARRSGAATLLHFRGTNLYRLLASDARRRWAVPLLRRPDRIGVLSRGEAEQLRAHGIERGVQLDNFAERRDVEHIPAAGPVRLVYVGWMIREKGLFELLEAVAQVPGVVLACVGRFLDDATRAEVEARIDALDLRDRVALHGEVSPQEVWAHHARADVFVFPSWTEGFPNALAEAMMSGLPAIVTPVGAVPEMLQDGVSARFVPVRQPDALASAIRELASDAELRARWGAAARAVALHRYEKEAVLTRLGDLWDQLIDEVRSRRGGSL